MVEIAPSPPASRTPSRRRRTTLLLALTVVVLAAVAATPLILGLGVHVVETRDRGPSLTIVRTVPVGDLRIGDRVVAPAVDGHHAVEVVGFQPGSYGVQDVSLAAATPEPSWSATADNPTAARVVMALPVPGLMLLLVVAALVMAAACGSLLTRRSRLRRVRVRDTPDRHR